MDEYILDLLERLVAATETMARDNRKHLELFEASNKRAIRAERRYEERYALGEQRFGEEKRIEAEVIASRRKLLKMIENADGRQDIQHALILESLGLSTPSVVPEDFSAES